MLDVNYLTRMEKLIHLFYFKTNWSDDTQCTNGWVHEELAGEDDELNKMADRDATQLVFY